MASQPERVTRADRRKAAADAIKEVQACCAILLDGLGNRMPASTAVPTTRQMVIAAYEVVHQFAALGGGDEAWASIRRGDTMEDGS